MRTTNGDGATDAAPGASCPHLARVTLDAAFKTDAPHRYAGLRATGPVHPAVLNSGVEGWLVVGHDEARQALTHPALLKDPAPAAEALRAAGFVTHRADLGGGGMLHTDPPTHTRLRRLVAGAFTPRRTAELRPRIEQLANDLIDALPPAGETDLVASFTAPIPVTVIAELLGIPARHRPDFQEWTSDGLALGTPRSETGFRNLNRLMVELIELKRAVPEDDLTSALIAVRDEDDGRLSPQELISAMRLLLIAGHETTLNLLGNAVLALLRHPGQLELLRANPDLLPSAVEEFLRYDGSAEITTMRYAAADLDIGGTPIERGSVVVVALSSASRDAPLADGGDPEHLDVTRPAARHLAFGHGIHHCLGAPLARLEATVALGVLLSRCHRLELAVPYGEIAWIPHGMMRGALGIPVRYERS
ncbi:cytochrome P450 family protein [Streptomyces sp. CWNU-52B]|uniref:cytochrome P450 family protein n=1 Tax=unclassified Streptomyces TaxID=2593676 RepID=UPI0039C464B5